MAVVRFEGTVQRGGDVAGGFPGETRGWFGKRRTGTASPSYAEEALAGFLIEVAAIVVEGGEEQVILPFQRIDAEMLEREPAGFALELLDEADFDRMLRDLEDDLGGWARMAFTLRDGVLAERMIQPIKKLAGNVRPAFLDQPIVSGVGGGDGRLV